MHLTTLQRIGLTLSAGVVLWGFRPVVLEAVADRPPNIVFIFCG